MGNEAVYPSDVRVRAKEPLIYAREFAGRVEQDARVRDLGICWLRQVKGPANIVCLRLGRRHAPVIGREEGKGVVVHARAVKVDLPVLLPCGPRVDGHAVLNANSAESPMNLESPYLPWVVASLALLPAFGGVSVTRYDDESDSFAVVIGPVVTPSLHSLYRSFERPDHEDNEILGDDAVMDKAAPRLLEPDLVTLLAVLVDRPDRNIKRRQTFRFVAETDELFALRIDLGMSSHGPALNLIGIRIVADRFQSDRINLVRTSDFLQSEEFAWQDLKRQRWPQPTLQDLPAQ